MAEARCLWIGVAFVVVALGGSACRSSRPLQAVAAPRPAPTPRITPLQLADRLFAAGDLEQAKDAYARHVEAQGEGADPQAAFRLALLLFRSESTADVRRGVDALAHIAAQPDHPYRLASLTLLELEGHRGRLEDELDDANRQLEALKRIDLDRRRN